MNRAVADRTTGGQHERHVIMSEPETDPPPVERHSGRHRLRFEPPDLVSLTFDGDITPDDMYVIAEVFEGAPIPRGAMLILCDVSALGHVPPESRRVIRERKDLVPFAALAYVNASFQTRIVIKLVLGALRLLAREELGPVRFFTAEGDARAWLAAHRRAP